MKNPKVNNFKAMADLKLKEQKEKILEDVSKHIQAFATIKLVRFSNVEPYEDVLKNTIFFTYSDHYRGNLGTWMDVCDLHHPHTEMYDRGYIKGVATDLNGYLILRSASMLSHNFERFASFRYPNFRKSKNSEVCKNACKDIVTTGMSSLNSFVLEQKKVLNVKLRQMSGCSLLHYLEVI